MTGIKYLVYALLLIGGFSLFPNTTYAELVFYDGFLQYGEGNLGTQNGWRFSSGDNALVTNNAYYQPTHAITTDGTNSFTIYKDFSLSPLDYSTITVSGAYMTTSNSIGSTNKIVGLYNTSGLSGSHEICGILRSSYEIKLGSSNASDTTIGYWATSTWAKYDIEIDVANDRCRARVNLGEWSPYQSIDAVGDGALISTSTMRIRVNSGVTEDEDESYWDELSVITGDVAGANQTVPYVDYTYPDDENNVTNGNFAATATIYDPQNDVPTHARVTLIKNTSGASAIALINEDVVLSGSAPWYISSPVNLDDGLYSYSVVPYRSTYDTKWFNDGISFSVGESSYYELIQVTYGNGLSTSTAALCQSPGSIFDVGGGISYALCSLFVPPQSVLTQYANIPNILATKFPFSYISGIFDVFEEVSGESASTTPAARYTFPLGATYIASSTGLATSTFTFFNPAAIVASVPVVTTLRTYMGYILYFMFGIFAFKRVIRLV